MKEGKSRLKRFYSGSAFGESMFLKGDLVISIRRNVLIVEFIVTNVSLTADFTVVLVDVKGQLD